MGLYALLLTFYHVFLEPLLCHFRLVTPGGGDPTYGRGSLPHSETERRLIFDNPDVHVERRRVPLGSAALADVGSWDRDEWHWVSYNVWRMPGVRDLNADIVLVHGLNDYAGKLVPHAHHFLQRGFRVIAIDLPSFGRSTGLHAHVPSMRINVHAMHAVILDVRRWDADKGHSEGGRKLFAEGHSMGGFTALYYAALFTPSEPNPDPATPVLSGIAVAAPMIAISPQSRPGKLTEIVAKILCFFAGRLPLARAIRGNVSDDQRVEDEFLADPQTYKGLLRISTGLAVLHGLHELQALAHRITCPLVTHHGANDRATNPQGSRDFFHRVGTPEDKKSLHIWDGYEHVMMKNVSGMSEEDERKRDAVLFKIADWLEEQAKAN